MNERIEKDGYKLGQIQMQRVVYELLKMEKELLILQKSKFMKSREHVKLRQLEVRIQLISDLMSKVIMINLANALDP